ncbi:ASCH domain-containing protein [Zavarzinella formosa]|uniref:ASCH domain-containing protein n=1 Tax=Zavarzinella formosa TaxID=360055 RepID=UPI0002DA2876|nr:ASCH domain-containing protein [Zavarzinella formosa]
MPAIPNYALSIKQPWATLLVSGIKKIEIRLWPTTIRGPVFIHAAKIPDPRPEGWEYLTPELKLISELGGQLMGMAVLEECREYRTASEFTRDQHLHRNDPSWFQPPQMHGFVFRDPISIRPIRVPGNVRFFTVDLFREQA